jgi:thermitase
MKYRKHLSFAALLVLTIVLFLTVSLSQRQQILEQQAARGKIGAIAGTAVEDRKTSVPGTLIVKYKSSSASSSAQTEQQVQKKLAQVSGKVAKKLDKINTSVVKVPIGHEKQAIQSLKSDPAVASVTTDTYVYGDFVPNDPSFNLQYALKNTGQNINGQIGTSGHDIHATAAWDRTRGSLPNGQPVTVAVIDSGIDASHPELSGKIKASQNFTTDGTSVDDQFGHGTHIAGIIAAKANNTTGIAGVCPDCQLLNARVLDSTNRGQMSWVAQAIIWATDNGAKVISMSLSANTGQQDLKDAIDYAWQHGVVIVAAAGNSGDSVPTYPSSYDHVLAVAATDNQDNKAGFSNYGLWVDVAAPGVNIYSTVPTKPYVGQGEWNTPLNYTYLSGTSMATPLVAGVAALIWASPYGISNDTVVARLEQTSDRIAGTGSYWQFGRVDADKAVAGAATVVTPTPTTLPTPSPTKQPTPTPTKVPTPTVVPPTSTPIPTPTFIPNGTRLNLTLFLHGLGLAGDSVRPASTGNTQPLHPQRLVTVTLYNAANSLVLQKTGLVTYNQAGGFSGTVDLGTGLASGSYIVKVKTDHFLQTAPEGVVTVSSGTSNALPSLTLVAGDVNGDNKLNILDYNLITTCYQGIATATTCTSTQIQQADLTDDGIVNQYDYNLFLREILVQNGQ